MFKILNAGTSNLATNQDNFSRRENEVCRYRADTVHVFHRWNYIVSIWVWNRPLSFQIYHLIIFLKWSIILTSQECSFINIVKLAKCIFIFTKLIKVTLITIVSFIPICKRTNVFYFTQASSPHLTFMLMCVHPSIV